MPIKGLIFDAYGTLYDVHSVQAKTEELCPGKGDLITQIWRLKQLEYTWLQTALQGYRDFGFITQASLVFALRAAGIEPRIGPHAATSVPAGAEVVYSTAVPADNPERALARESGGSGELHRAELLAQIAARNGLAKLSMGMSADFETAVRFGATSVRVGSALFGAR